MESGAMNLIEKVQRAGVVGEGGAGFPTHIKLNASAEYLIINAAECEPLLQTDQFLMKEQSLSLVGGILMTKHQVGADKAVIAVKGKYTEAIASLKSAIARLGAAIDIFELQNFYPAGDEQMTVYEVTGRAVPPGGIPLHVGCVVSNVGTMISVFEAAQDIPVTGKYVSVLGDVKTPRVIKVPVGTSFEECLQASGGPTKSDYAVIRGGPMMGAVILRDQLSGMHITKVDGALIVVPADHCLVKRSQLSTEQIIERAKACIQCGYCTEQCPRYLIGHDLHPHKMVNLLKYGADLEWMADETAAEAAVEAQLCCGCGVCELYACPIGIDPRQVNFLIGNKLKQKGIRYQHDGKPVEARDMREYRKIPPSQLIGRLDLERWHHQPLHPFLELTAETVTLPLCQHVGGNSTPVVAVGERVNKGQPVAEMAEGKMGSTIHASIDGMVTMVGSDSITLSGAGAF